MITADLSLLFSLIYQMNLLSRPPAKPKGPQLCPDGLAPHVLILPHRAPSYTRAAESDGKYDRPD